MHDPLCSLKEFPYSLDAAPLPVARFQLWMWGLKIDSRNDCSTSPLDEQLFGIILLVPLFTVSFS
jgi:hypothetical protein